MLVLFGLALASVALAGGRLGRLADLELRHPWAVAAAVGVQVLALGAFDEHGGELQGALHLASYGLATIFLWANRGLPGLWLIGLGGAANLAAISANGGVMPASAAALASAGLDADGGGGFANSAAVAEADLAFLGDVFAIPAAWPLSNVFSIGDGMIGLGLAVVLHAACGSRLVPSRTGELLALARQRRFARVWLAQTVSNLGDFVYSLAVAVSVVEQGLGAGALATILVVQTASAAVVGLLGAPLVDRLPRRRIMVGCDIARAAAVGSLLLAGSPSTAHILLVAACLGSFGALFQPALQASLPNLVPERLLVAANALVTGTFHVAVLAGPVLGGVLAASLGIDAAFALNAVSFLLSAVLFVGVQVPRAEAADEGEEGLRSLAEGLRHVVATPLLRGIALTTGIAMFAASIKQPIEPLFVVRGLGGAAGEVGLVVAAWGLGMVLGCAVAPALARRAPREALMAASLLLMGAVITVAATVGGVAALLWLWLLGGAGNGVLTVAYESLLQERTPDRLRGRVVAANEAGLDVMSVAGLVVAGVVGGALGFRGAFALAGLLLLVAALLARPLLRERRSPALPLAPAPAPGPRGRLRASLPEREVLLSEHG
ncbi:MAG: MFS transporter [Actinomycetota bacterium]|nr:MFS transporter [Actinomycetota bacterium]